MSCKKPCRLSTKCFSRIGKPLPRDFDWDAIIRSIPKEAFQLSWSEALKELVFTLLMLALGVCILAVLPWFFAPLGWCVMGLAATGAFVITRDCNLKAWSPSELVNSIVGFTLSFPLLHGLRSRSRGLILEILLFALGITVLVYYTGLRGFMKYWFAPFLGYMWWRNTFTKILETVPENVNLNADSYWPATFFQFPRFLGWMERICHNINYYIPSGESLAAAAAATTQAIVPSYNLRKAYLALQDDWAEYLTECALSWRTLRELMFRKSVVGEGAVPAPIKKGVDDDDDSSEDAQEQTEQTGKRGKASVVDEDRAEVVANVTEEERHRGGLRYWLKKIHWLNVTILFTTPILGVYGALSCPFDVRTWAWAGVYYFLTGIGITAGYHRLWSHRSYHARGWVQVLLMLFGTGAVQGSALWWCRNHRVHHRYTDSDRDPYSAAKGFFWAHFGWMMVHPDPNNYAKADISDLKQNRVLHFQHQFYIPLVLLMGLTFPSLVAGLLWGDYRGGFYIVGALRLVFVHHTTFCVNSVAHFFGEHTYDDERTPKDHIVTALLTLGEGYHNFHHEFPNDYRNGIRVFDYDPTKWVISFLSWFGATYDLKVFPENEIKKGKINMKQKRLDEMRRRIKWPKSVDKLPELTWDEVAQQIQDEKRALVIVDGLVHDVSHFMEDHPGGEAILRQRIGTDASTAFHGGVYKHSHAARNLLTNFRVARLAPDSKKTD